MEKGDSHVGGDGLDRGTAEEQNLVERFLYIS
jgi:hypothetical protein